MGDTIGCMTDSPYGVTPGGAWPPPGPPVGAPPVWPPAPAKQSRAPITISLVVALIAIAVAIGAWFKPANEAPPSADTAPKFSDQQTADAKKALCSARNKAFEALKGSGGQHSDDPTSAFIITVNTRLAIHESTDYLRHTRDVNQAAPPDLAANIEDLASVYEDMLLAQLASAPTDQLNALNTKLDAADIKIVEACK
jgi:hypothetical protein